MFGTDLCELPISSTFSGIFFDPESVSLKATVADDENKSILDVFSKFAIQI